MRRTGAKSSKASKSADLKTLQETLGWHFDAIDLLKTALTHSTYANENPAHGASYERLEFLGDAVLELLASALLFDWMPKASEGDLSRRRARVVRRETLAALAKELGLDPYIRLGRGQHRLDGSAGPRILADVFEAVLGAVYLDGGYTAAHDCFANWVQKGIEHTEERQDHKTQLQELCHQRGLASPSYRVVDIRGPDHDRIYICEVDVEGVVWGSGEGSSKKIAEQQCAQEAMRLDDAKSRRS